MPEAEVALPHAVASVPAARRFVATALHEWGYEQESASAELLVSELATNCTLHARTDFQVRLVLDRCGCLRLEVSDRSPRPPRQRTFGLDASTGRGLHLVAALSRDWGVHLREDGKTVWALLRPGDDDPDDGAGDDDVDALLAAFGGG